MYKYFMILFVLVFMTACGGGSKGSVSGIPISEPEQEPDFITQFAWGGSTLRALPKEVRLDAIVKKISLTFVNHSIKLSQKDLDLFLSKDDDPTYDISFWNNFRVIGDDGIEYPPASLNSASVDTKHIRYRHFGDPGSCIIGDGISTGYKDFVECYFLYEIPLGVKIIEATFMNENWFIKVGMGIQA